MAAHSMPSLSRFVFIHTNRMNQLLTRPTIILLLVLLASGAARAQAPTWAWGVTLGNTDDDEVNAIASDASGNVYAVGTFQDNVDFDPGPGSALFSANGVDAFMLKLDDAGALVWAKRLTGSGHQWAQCIAVDPAGNVYVAGQLGITPIDMDPGPGTFMLNATSSYDVFVMKLDNAGDFVWAKAMGGNSTELPNEMTTDANGHVYVCGRYVSDSVDFDPGPGTHMLVSNGGWDAFVVELDTDGNFVWANSVGSDTTGYTEEALSIAVDDDGDVFVTGVFADTVDFDPGPAVVEIVAVEHMDMFVTKYNTDGDLVWARSIGGPYTQQGGAIAIDADANILITGGFSSGTDFDPNAGVVIANAWLSDLFVLKLDSATNFQWVRTVGETANQHTYGDALRTDAYGNIFLACDFTGSMDADPGPGTLNLNSAGGSDVLMMKLDAAGSMQWISTMQGSAADKPSSMVLGNTGSLYVAVNYNSPDLAFGGIMVNNAGGSSGTPDMLIARLDSTDLATGLVVMDPTHPEVMAYPDPFTDQLVVGGCNTRDELRLLDMSGRCVLHERALGTSTTLHTALLKSGVYVLELGRGTTVLRSKVVKE